jgi:S1-C subfamily serine protease
MNKLIISVILLASSVSFGAINYPKTVAELKDTSVRILNLAQTSGGTGSILKSFANASHILTNKHICRLIEPGGVVDYRGQQFLITHYKKFEQHDLCIVRVAVNLEKNLAVSATLVKPSDTAIVSGHPNLLPHIATIGHLSERTDIELLSGIKPCTEKDLQENLQICMWFGGMPVIAKLNAQLISNLIKPGNSGSAVFNKKGEIIGVVFAGNSRDFSYGYIVPQIYVLFFLQNADKFEWVKVGTPVDDEGMSDRVFNFEKCEEVRFKEGSRFDTIKKLCKNSKDSLIWRK